MHPFYELVHVLIVIGRMSEQESRDFWRLVKICEQEDMFYVIFDSILEFCDNTGVELHDLNIYRTWVSTMRLHPNHFGNRQSDGTDSIQYLV